MIARGIGQFACARGQTYVIRAVVGQTHEQLQINHPSLRVRVHPRRVQSHFQAMGLLGPVAATAIGLAVVLTGLS